MSKLTKDTYDRRFYNIVKSREFIWKSRVNLGYRQNRLLCYILSNYEPSVVKYPDGTIFTRDIKTEYVMDIPDYARRCEKQPSGAFFNAVKKDLKFLRDNSIWFKNDRDGKETISWLSNIEEYKGQLIYTFDKRAIKYIDNLEGINHGYLKYDFNEILHLDPRKNIIQLFELMYSHQFEKEFDISFDDLLWYLFMEDNKYYCKAQRFNNKILKPCIDSINKSTSLIIEYETYGNPIQAYSFSIKKKDPISLISTI